MSILVDMNVLQRRTQQSPGQSYCCRKRRKVTRQWRVALHHTADHCRVLECRYEADPEWRRLVVQHNVPGVKVHDARLVAAMNVHNVPRILTFNAGDFLRYGIEVIEPQSLVL